MTIVQAMLAIQLLTETVALTVMATDILMETVPGIPPMAQMHFHSEVMLGATLMVMVSPTSQTSTSLMIAL